MNPSYLQSIKAIPLLSSKEERDLVHAIAQARAHLQHRLAQALTMTQALCTPTDNARIPDGSGPPSSPTSPALPTRLELQTEVARMRHRLALTHPDAHHPERRALDQQLQDALDSYRSLTDHFVLANLRLVVAAASTYFPSIVPFADLVQEGTVSLLRAADRFDPTRGNRFATYALWYIRQGIFLAFRQDNQFVHIPSYVMELHQDIERQTAQLEQEHQQSPAHDLLASAVGLSETRLGELLQLRAPQDSLDEQREHWAQDPAHHESDQEEPPHAVHTRPKEIQDRDTPSPDWRLIQHDQRRVLTQILDILTPVQRAVIAGRIGLDADTPETLQAIGDRLGYTRERIRQIETKALERISKYVKYHELSDELRP